MERNEILTRLVNLSLTKYRGRTGWITAEEIEKDPILTMEEIEQNFGNLKKAVLATQIAVDQQKNFIRR